MHGRIWTQEEAQQLRELRLDPVQDPPGKLIPLVNHFYSGGSIFAVTGGKGPVQVSRDLARKVLRLSQNGELKWLLDQAHDEEVTQHSQPRVQSTDEGAKSKEFEQFLDVLVDTDCQNHYLGPGPTLNWLGPVNLRFHITNRTLDVISHPRLHLWFQSGRVFPDHGLNQTPIWRNQGTSRLPSKWRPFEAQGQFERYSVRLFPDDDFSVFPSRHPVLSCFQVLFTPFTGMIPIPWEIEIPGHESVGGCLLVWRSREGVFRGGGADPELDFDKLAGRVDRQIAKN